RPGPGCGCRGPALPSPEARRGTPPIAGAGSPPDSAGPQRRRATKWAKASGGNPPPAPTTGISHQTPPPRHAPPAGPAERQPTPAVAAGAATSAPAFAATSTQILDNQTFPRGGVVLTGADGQQHLWTPDHLNGVCRVDQNADGTFTLDKSSCLLAFGGSPAIK